MQRSATRLIWLSLAVVLFNRSSVAQNQPENPYQKTLDHLASLINQPLPEWRFNADVPHPEDPQLNDANWSTLIV